MTIKQNDKGLWDVQFYCKDYTGKNKKYHKRNFRTKKEAREYVEEFIRQQDCKLDVSFETFVKGIYKVDMQSRLRQNTMNTKEHIIEMKILPYFGKKKLNQITAADIRKWQNTLINKGCYSQTYLRTINNQLSAIFNYAVKYYDLTKNPCTQAGNIGKDRADEMEYWSVEEFNQFLEVIKDKPLSYYAFSTFYWTGIRLGELLALQVKDFDYEEKQLTISKSLQRIKKEDIITDPKTAMSKRIIDLPESFATELQEYISKLYGITLEDRLFHVTKSYLEHEIIRGSQLAGIKKIRVHDLRHSHASMLISELGAQPRLVADRLGHEKINTTLQTYSHLYPNQSKNLAKQLDELKRRGNEGNKQDEVEE